MIELAGKNRIWFNTIRRTGRDCIQLYGASAEDIRYNDISDSGLMCKDLGLVHVYGRDGQSTRIAYDWFHDNRGKGPNPGIYFDNYCRNFIVDHNVIWNCEAGVRVNGPAEGHRIYNNTLFNCDDVGTHTYPAWPPGVHLNRQDRMAGQNLPVREGKQPVTRASSPAAVARTSAVSSSGSRRVLMLLIPGSRSRGSRMVFSGRRLTWEHMNLVERGGSRACVDEPNEGLQRTRTTGISPSKPRFFPKPP